MGENSLQQDPLSNELKKITEHKKNYKTKNPAQRQDVFCGAYPD